MVRRISGDPAIVKGSRRAPLGPLPVLTAPPAPTPVAPVRPAPLRPVPPSEGAWMAEILFEAQFDPQSPSAHPGPQDEGSAAQRRALGGFNRQELLAASDAPAPGEGIRSVAQYRAVLGRLFDEKADQATRDMLQEPVLVSMQEVWTPGRPEVNRRVATEFMRYFLPKLGEAYGFKPCPVEFNDTLCGGYNGLYELRRDRVYLPERSLRGTLAEFIDVLVHEEMHCMQERLIGRLNLSKGGVPLNPDERAIATYWRN